MCDACQQHCDTIKKLKEHVTFVNDQLTEKTAHIENLQQIVRKTPLELSSSEATSAYLQAVRPLPSSKDEKLVAHLIETVKHQSAHITHLEENMDHSHILLSLHDRLTAVSKILEDKGHD